MNMDKLAWRFGSGIAVGCVLFLAVAGCSKESPTPSRSQVSDNPAASRVVSSNTTLLSTVTNLADKSDSEASTVVFSAGGHGVAYLEKGSGQLRVVYNGKAGKAYPVISHLRLSPDGRHVAHDMLVDGKRRMVLDGSEGKPYDDVFEPVFSPDSRHLAYVAQVGQEKLVVVDGKESARFPGFAYDPVFSADSSRLAFVESATETSKPRLVLCDLQGKSLSAREVEDYDLVTDRDRTRIAAISRDGSKLRVIELGFDRPDAVQEGERYDLVDKLAYGGDGASLCYLAKEGGKSYLVANGRKEPLPDGDMREAPVLRPGNSGAGVILVGKDGRYYLHETLGGGKDGGKYDEAAQLTYNADGSRHAYCAKDGKKFFIVLNGKQGPVFDMVISPMFSPDGRLLVYRARKDGKRFVVVADADGKILRQHPGYELVFDTVFTADGKSVAYGVKDGDKLIWKVEKL
jgi:WD40 repeat protein